MSANFYIYEHWRLDRDECFYVGKGRGGRAYSRKGRNRHWSNIVAKLDRIGSGYEVRLVATGLTEQDAFDIERERISFWRDRVDLANVTNGGEGVSGYKHSAEIIQKMSAINKALGIKPPVLFGEANPFYGKKHTEETRAKIASARLGKPASRKKKNLSEEGREKLSALMKGKKLRLGKRHTEETRAKISEKAKLRFALAKGLAQ